MQLTLKQVLQKTNWKLLKKQKQALLKACERDSTLDGLLHWVDALQDAAHAAGYPVEFLGIRKQKKAA